MTSQPLKATLLDDDAFRLLAIPFGGPIPSGIFPRGIDVDGETFTERTDIKPKWLAERLVDWHHGVDPLMGRTVIGKAVDPEMDEEGWWVTVWTKHGERRLELIKRLAERQPIYGSSESIAGMVKKAYTGEILVWPYWRQTLSTSPQNTKSVLKPLKASIDDLYATGGTPTAAFWADLSADLTNLQSDLVRTSRGGDDPAKAGRVLSAINEAALRKAIDAAALPVIVIMSSLYRRPLRSVIRRRVSTTQRRFFSTSQAIPCATISVSSTATMRAATWMLP